MLFCDFCGVERLGPELKRYRAIAEVKAVGREAPVGNVSHGDWAACEICDAMVREEAWDLLAQRSLEIFEINYGASVPRHLMLAYLKELHQEFKRARL